MMATTLFSIPMDAASLKLTSLIVVVAIIIYITLFSSTSKKEASRYSYFRNGYGEPLEMLPQDTRITRFTHGAELSLQGLQRFPEKPFLVKNGSITELVIFNAAQVRDFYAGDGKDHLKPRDCNFGDYWERMLGDCVGMQNGQTWHTSRSYMDPYLAFSQAAARVSDFQGEFQNWATRLCNDPRATASKTEKGFCIDSVAACRELPFKLIAMALYGDMLTESLYEQLWSLNLMHEQITHSAFLEKLPQMWWYRWLPTKANRVLKAYEDRWLELNVKVIADARKANVDCVMEKIYHGLEAGDMSMVMFLQSVDEILFTNIDVTSTMFAGSVINLGRNPTFQNTLREEIEAQDKEDMTSYLRREDTLLHKTYMEVLRINPPAWYSLPEITAKDKRIADYLIPAGTSVTIDCNRLNKLSQVWGTDGHLFRPERFNKLSASQVRYSMHGYGMGPRKCLGKNFANLIIKLLIVTVLTEFELGVEGEKSVVNRESFTRSPEQMVFFRYRKGGRVVGGA